MLKADVISTLSGMLFTCQMAIVLPLEVSSHDYCTCRCPAERFKVPFKKAQWGWHCSPCQICRPHVKTFRLIRLLWLLISPRLHEMTGCKILPSFLPMCSDAKFLVMLEISSNNQKICSSRRFFQSICSLRLVTCLWDAQDISRCSDISGWQQMSSIARTRYPGAFSLQALLLYPAYRACLIFWSIIQSSKQLLGAGHCGAIGLHWMDPCLWSPAQFTMQHQRKFAGWLSFNCSDVWLKGCYWVCYKACVKHIQKDALNSGTETLANEWKAVSTATSWNVTPKAWRAQISSSCQMLSWTGVVYIWHPKPCLTDPRWIFGRACTF